MVEKTPFSFKTLSALIGLIILIMISLQIGVLGTANINDSVFTISRLPRTIAVLLTGAGLAVAGMVIQLIVHNRFVEPNTTGTGEGAAIGLLLTVLLFPAAPLIVRMGFAALCAMLSLLIFLTLAKRLPPTDPLLLPLVGMIYAGILQSIMAFIGYETDLLQWLSVWLNGDFSAVLKGRYEFLWGCAIVLVILYWLADRLTIVGMGESSSQSLGLNYRQLVFCAILLIALISAFITATVGNIAFLGLVVPNLIRRICGDNLRHALPWIAWTGASLLLICDILARIVSFPYEIPVSLIFGIFGGSLFLYLLMRPSR
ncbi:ABC transporter permease [Suttonella ornithocola]|uniref:Iron-uptake system permease protein FeuB n=1 Tax=Suttonella ornithocola TaxID=279832 RepID=A0A380MLI0_9GAMM|nr:iron chelate uptake ABC transporter family permease subunit [Suttonella ornithocola]SUO93172.1 Iron-uptake system permease protein FeuB [Suttonella ornithocola]